MDLTECVFGIGGHAPDALLIAHVEFERNDAAPERLHFRFEAGKRLALTAGEDEAGARAGE